MHEATDPWGVQVERVEVKDVRVPEQLMRAMAAEAEAARNARAKVIAAEGEHKASRALSHAAAVIGESPAAMQLRYLQTLRDQAVTLHHQHTAVLRTGSSGMWDLSVKCNSVGRQLDIRGEQHHHHLPAPHRHPPLLPAGAAHRHPL